jgi:fructokinase
MCSKISDIKTNKRSKTSPLIIFGEVLFDAFPDGKRVLGGAPFNVAWGLQGLGQQPLFVSAVGRDDDGKKIRSGMEAWGMDTSGLQVNDRHATGIVEVSIEDDEPRYNICENRAWDFVEDAGWRTDGILYHGLLSLRGSNNRSVLESLRARSGAQRFFDVNLRPPYDSMVLVKTLLAGTHWLKLNLEEFKTLHGEEVAFENCHQAVDEFRERHRVKNVILTAGSEGALIQGEGGRAVCAPAPEPDPFVDTVGAGDAFAARTIHGILQGESVEKMTSCASAFAAKVCGLQGATIDDPEFYKG